VPVLHEYENDAGVYLRTNIDGTFVTFQVYRSAARLLSKIGYEDGDTIGWGFLKPLWERGYIYTGNSGTTNKVETHLEKQKLNLKGNKKEKLETFLKQQKRESITVPKDIYPALVDWHNGKYSKERARDLLYQANDEQICCRSIREFSQCPISVVGIETSKGDPAYDVVSKGYEMRCVDVREADQEIDLIITYRSESGHPQGLFVSDGNLDKWKIYGSEEASDRHYYDLFERFPAICELLVNIPEYDLKLDEWDFDGASRHSISDEIRECLQLDWDWSVYSIGRSDGESSSLSGNVRFFSSLGYGIVESDELTKDLVFKSGDESFSENQEVSFKFQRKNGRMRAKNLGSIEGTSQIESTDGTNIAGAGDGKTKYGRQLPQSEEARRQAEQGELDWSEGVITRLNHSDGHGYAKLEGETLYFSLNALSDRSLSKSDSVRAVVSNDGERALFLEPKDGDEPDESTDGEDHAGDQPLQPGESRIGWLRYLNMHYGSLAVQGCSETIMFESQRLPLRREDATLGMAFSFKVIKDQGGLRAKDLEREPEKAHTGDDSELFPESENTGDDTNPEETVMSTPVNEETATWVTRNASSASEVFHSIELANEFGVEAMEYEDSIQKYGHADGFEINDFCISDKGHPVYQFALDDGSWRVEHCITRPEPVLDIRVCPESSPHHQARAVDGNLLYWRPKFNHGRLSDEARHEYVLEQGRYAEIVDDYLSLTQ
jgi:cold shock CspA family protein